MIDHDHDLPITHLCRVLGVARSTVYYRRQPVSEADHTLMRRIDALHLERPFLGSRRIADALAAEVVQLMRQHSINGLFAVDPEQRPIGALNALDLMRAGIF